jgi:DNA-binding HxlR family transcriptional regulator
MCSTFGYRGGAFQDGAPGTSSISVLAGIFFRAYGRRMKGYGQFCPIAKAAEILTERWTPLVLRELICGSTRFNDLRRGVPLMSASLLSQRLRFLEQEGVIERRAARAGHGEYHLTDAGRGLEPLIMAMGEWGARWVPSRLGPEDQDVALLMWDMRRRVRAENFPPGRTVVAFEFPDAPQGKRHWWLVSEQSEADLCLTDPGYEVDLFVVTDVRTMTAVWTGELSLDSVLTSGALEAHGPPDLCRRLNGWLGLSAFAPIRSKAQARTAA